MTVSHERSESCGRAAHGEDKDHINGDSDSPRKKVKSNSPPRYDEHFSDPDAKVVLVSVDGVRFRVSAYFLDQTCHNFRDNKEDTTLPIETVANSATLRIFVDMVYSSAPSSVLLVSKVAISGCSALLELATRFGSPEIVAATLSKMKMRVSEDPWTVFVVASQRDLLDLAKTALSLFKNGAEQKLEDWTHLDFQDFKDVRPTYMFELLRLVGLSRENTSQPRCFSLASGPPPLLGVHQEIDWEWIMDEFKPWRHGAATARMPEL